MTGTATWRIQRIAIGAACCALLSSFPDVAFGESLWSANLITNPSFEDGEKWPVGWTERPAVRLGGEAIPVQMSAATKVRHGEERSLELLGNSFTTAWFSVESDPVPVTPGRRYRFTGWMKTKDVEPVEDQFHHCNLHARFTSADEAPAMVDGFRLVVTETVGGTKDWSRFEKFMVAPAGAAQVHIGCVLTCAGWAWFDDIALHEQAVLDWERTASDNFVFLYEGDDAPDKKQIDEAEGHLARIKKFLDLKHEGKLHYYKYASQVRKRQITGNDSAMHSAYDGIHGLRWDDKHEVVHALMSQVGFTTTLLTEGIAVYLESKWTGPDLNDHVRKRYQETTPASIAALADDHKFNESSKEANSAAAGSFVGYMVESRGVEPFKRLYGLVRPREQVGVFQQRFREVYAQSLEDVEAEWRAKLGLSR